MSEDEGKPGKALVQRADAECGKGRRVGRVGAEKAVEAAAFIQHHPDLPGEFGHVAGPQPLHQGLEHLGQGLVHQGDQQRHCDYRGKDDPGIAVAGDEQQDEEEIEGNPGEPVGQQEPERVPLRPAEVIAEYEKIPVNLSDNVHGSLHAERVPRG